jgi:hypothetical protein
MNEKVQVRAVAGVLAGSALRALIEDLAGRFRYMILASSEDRLFEPFSLSRARDLDAWPMGQVFGPDGELCWRPKRGRFAVCFVAEGDTQPEPVAALEEKEELRVEWEELWVRLWGEHTADDVDADGRPFWFEAQVPRLLTYPIEDTAPPSVALRVVRYLRDDGAVAFVRFVELEGWNHG